MKPWIFAPPFIAALAAGCSSPPPPQSFAPLNYSYLPPIVFKVANLTVANNYVPTPNEATLIGEDPEPPATALLAMLNHRIVASGAPGTGTVTIEVASIDQAGGNLTGAMTVDIHLVSADGRSTGFTEATVSASHTAPDSDASQNDVQAALYDLTKQLMDNMNVQLQYQVQHNLGPWLSWSSTPGVSPLAVGAAPSTGAIQATPLTAPASTTTTTTTTTGPAPLPTPTGNINPAIPQYLPGAGPAALTPAQ
jgi:hypothetical protein